MSHSKRMSARRMLQWLLVVQAVGAAAIAFAAWRLFGAAPWMALALGLACVVLVRLVINMNNFVLSACFASPTPREFHLGWRARLRLLAEEYRSSMLATSWFMPHARACRRIEADSGYVPVLLIHGYGCNSGYWRHLMPRLERNHISYAAIDLEPVGGAIDGYVPLVERAVAELCAATGAAQVAIVAHSMGGLVARAWMREYGSARVARLVTLGTPHHGTGLANFGLGANAAQMRRVRGVACDWLCQLAASEDPARRALVTSIFSHHDNIVSPQTSSVLEGARNLALGGVGHVALGCNGRVLDLVMEELGALTLHNDAQAPALLLVDDDPFMLAMLQEALQGQGWRLLAAGSGAAALAVLAREPVAAIVSDHLMPDLSGAALLAQARRLQPASARILLSGARDDPAIAAALETGDADAFQAKPWRLGALLALLEDARAVYNAGTKVQAYNGLHRMRKR
ncbi:MULTISPECIES: alpha/beta fold hydrolase [unclassified Massilia]|uniref:alpha/beta fold hydrolase n=1 Tax=unclassified Massilia TaxID=2609279 RepID=UPI00177C38F1|nr:MULTISPECIES: alpha/beta fold hydrolase [unclassified Massilia]MBD8533345.1 alpha/beta fold hydrolase [Massilia sp. CFBP 13647]MBD8676738.1 alpha/beta fold hydrolase [Massilia sp. CFBP 13721]